MKRREFIKCSAIGFLGALAFPKSLLSSQRKMLVLGKSKIIVPKASYVGTQVDRVVRDIAWKNSKFDERADPHRRIRTKEDVVPYMEGRMVQFLMDYADVKVCSLSPARAVRKMDGFYYAGDGTSGNYPFLIDPSKVDYPTAAFLDGRNKAILPDTHGFNMVAEEARRMKILEKLDLVIACMDTPAKADAALFLARNGINCFGPCDRFAYQLIGYRKLVPKGVTIMGTAPIRKHQNGAVIGDQPVSISLEEKIVVQFTEKGYPDQYCDTPARYFKQLEKILKLKLNLKSVAAGVGETFKVVAEAEKSRSKAIGVRIFNQEDAKPVAEWLKKDKSNRAIFFHSAPYEPGYEMFFRFPEQTSFGDLEPIVE
ncbi:MAG: hypothetical protein NT136_01825 [Candidatus Moranbacteria bacterium]|nr:hypothetical protein [Candidatus Moranbacteria bacterium]